MQVSKRETFTSEEIAFMQNGQIFDEKEGITMRIQKLLVELQQSIKITLKPEEFLAPRNTDFVNGQLVRGERFHQRPYVYLDFPKFFSRQAIFTFRSFFWWGWDFVFAFVLSGPYLDRYKKNLLDHLDAIVGKGYYVSLAPDPWEWRKTSPETVEIAGRSASELGRLIKDMNYLKIQHFVGLDHSLRYEGGFVEKGHEVFERLKFVVAP